MFSKRTVCFITGASRGLGESIALNFSTQFPHGSLFVLLARSEGSLKDVRDRLLLKSPNSLAVAICFDQGLLDDEVFSSIFSKCFTSAGVKPEDFEQALLVNNAGSLEPLVYARNLPDIGQLAMYFSINVTGVIALTSKFLKAFPKSTGISRVIINISSLCALKPTPSWALYCTGKAARDMFFKVVAEEEKDIRVINYAPGPLDTEMINSTLKCEHEEMRNFFIDAKANNTLLTCDTTVSKLISVLDKNTFESGIHLDYYDEF